MEPPSARSETAQQLALLRARLQQNNPQLYRHWALYLQVLREELEGVVNKACFQLAVSELPLRYSALPAASRHQLHVRLARLVKRTASLLTVEQLQALAQQSERRQQRLALRQQRRLLAAMQSDRPQAPPLFGQDASAADPPGSVRLGMALPIQSDLFGQHPQPLQADRSGHDAGLSDQERAETVAAEQDSEALMQVFASLLENEARAEVSGPRDPEAGLLPVQPLQLLAWFDGLDAALARRLRNLSHAINVELVRQGLSNTLLPLRTLEAIATGQIETQDAPLHLVRLAVPGMRMPVGRSPEVLALLLRPADLEADAPRLRTCRSRLQQARQEVRRMAQTDQRLERRLQALDAEALWLHDHSTAHQSNTPATE